MKIHQLSPLDAVASLKSSVAGLSDAEVARRLREYGRNHVEKVVRRPVVTSLLFILEELRKWLVRKKLFRSISGNGKN